MKKNLYVKIDKNLHKFMSDSSINNGKGLSSLARLVYVVGLPQCHMDMNSKVSNASYSLIMKATGIQSKATIRKCLVELESNGFIIPNSQNGLKSQYLLLKGIFFGLEEFEFSKTSSNAEPVTGTPSEPLSSSNVGNIYNTKNKTTTLCVDHLKFSNNSPFSKLSREFLKKLLENYSFNIVNQKISDLELIYSALPEENKEVSKNPEGLLRQALKEDWKITPNVPNQKIDIDVLKTLYEAV